MGNTASYTIESTPTGPDAPQENQGQAQDGLLAGKYTSQEELEKGTLELIKKQAGGDLSAFYKKLESGQIKLGEEPQAESQQQEESGQETSKPTESRDEAKNVLEQHGLKLEDFEQEFIQNGELSDESYQKLQELFPKSMIDAYIEGQKALAERSTAELLDLAGGQEAYQEMIQWASANLSEQEIKYFNQALESGDMIQAKFAVSGLASRFQSETGRFNKHTQQKPNLVQGQNPSQGSVSGYQSKAEMIRDMQNPLYASDPAFRQQVEEKLKRTTAF